MVYRKDERITYGPAKHFQRARWEADVCSIPAFFDGKEKKMLCDLLDLPGEGAPIFQLFRPWLHEDARYIGVDNNPRILHDCRRLYRGDERAEWVCEYIEKMLSEPNSELMHVRAIHFDTFYGWSGQPLRKSLVLLRDFIKRQQKAHGGEFLLGLNVVCRGTGKLRDGKGEAQDFITLVKEVFPTVDIREACMRYMSRETGLIYTSIRFSPTANAYISAEGRIVNSAWLQYQTEQEK